MYRPFALIIFTTVALSLLLPSCDCHVFDDLSACPGKVSIYFYSQMATQPEKTYPEDVRDLNVYIFDKQGVLVSVQQLNDVHLSPDFHIDVNLPEGDYTLVAVAGEYKAPYAVADAEIGKTTLSDLMMSIDLVGKSPSDPLHELYHTKPMNITIPSPGKGGDINTRYDMNLLPFTKRVHIYIHGLDLSEDYDVTIESIGTTYGYDGRLLDQNEVTYNSSEKEVVDINGEKFANYDISLPGLLEHIKSSVIVIRDKNTGKVLKTLQLYNEILALIPQIDVEHTYDYDIMIYLKETSTQYITVKLIINGWVYLPKETEL